MIQRIDIGFLSSQGDADCVEPIVPASAGNETEVANQAPRKRPAAGFPVSSTYG
jgi:hypothetical protein